MKYLYSIVWEFEDINREADWTHFVSEKEFISEAEEWQKVKEFMQELDENIERDEITNIWCNRIDTVEGFNIEVKENV